MRGTSTRIIWRGRRRAASGLVETASERYDCSYSLRFVPLDLIS